MAVFVFDSFTDADGTALASHAGERGATWTKHPDFTSGEAIITTNRAHRSTLTAVYYASGIPVSADYDVEVGYVWKSTAGNPLVCGRMSASVTTYYMLQYDAGGAFWRIAKVIAGAAPVTLGATWADTFTSGSRTVKLEMRDTTLKAYIDGTERISTTDSEITAAGRVGFRDNAGSTTTGYHLDSFTATDAEIYIPSYGSPFLQGPGRERLPTGLTGGGGP